MENPAIEALLNLKGEELNQEKSAILAAPALRYLQEKAVERTEDFRAELTAAESLSNLSESGMRYLRLAVVSRFVESMFQNTDDEPVSDERIYQVTVRQIQRNEGLAVDVLKN